MNQYILKHCGYSLVCALALSAGLRAQTTPRESAENRPAPATGTVLVLDNDRTLEGEIERVGDQYRLRRADAVSWVPPQASAVLCTNLREAYLVLRQRANLRDPDERVRLAQWCVAKGLKAEGMEEAKEAVTLNPEHQPAKRLVRHLENMRQNEALEASKGGKPQVEQELSTALALEMTAPSLGVFTSRIQPILMNACASCHATGRGGDFKLARAYSGNSANRKITQQNASSVMSQITPGQPLASPLLVKAVSVHGDQTQPALRGRQTEPFRILEEWVRQVSREHMANRLKDSENGIVVTKAPAPTLGTGEVKTADYRPDSGGFASAPPSRPAPPPLPGNAPPPPAPMKNPNPDPYDPDIFNGKPQSAPATSPSPKPGEPGKLPPLPEGKPARE